MEIVVPRLRGRVFTAYGMDTLYSPMATLSYSTTSVPFSLAGLGRLAHCAERNKC